MASVKKRAFCAPKKDTKIAPVESIKRAKPVNGYKPGSLLARMGGMVPTVQLGKHASTEKL